LDTVGEISDAEIEILSNNNEILTTIYEAETEIIDKFIQLG
jgi:hypothetical protein